MKKLYVLINVFILMLLATACWNYREVEQLTIVAGFAIDKTFDGKYLLTFEIVDLHEAKGEGKVKSVLVESEGETLMNAIRNSIGKNFPKLYFGHTTVIIICQEVAQEGVLKVIDFMVRDAEPRLNLNLFVSMDTKAGDILKTKVLTSEIVSEELTNILDEQKNLAKALPIPVYKFIHALVEEGISGIMNSVCIEVNNEEKVAKLCGTAVFKEDKFQGVIDEEETYALSFILDEVKGGIIVVDVGSGPEEEKISLEILKSSTKIEPVYEDNKLSIKVSIDTKVVIAENGSKKNYTDKEGREELIKLAEEQLKKKIESIIEKIQKEFGADIFGFGNKFYKELPKVWKEKRNEWNEIFKDLEVTIETNIKIEHTSLLSEPIKMGD